MGSASRVALYIQARFACDAEPPARGRGKTPELPSSLPAGTQLLHTCRRISPCRAVYGSRTERVEHQMEKLFPPASRTDWAPATIPARHSD